MTIGIGAVLAYLVLLIGTVIQNLSDDSDKDDNSNSDDSDNGRWRKKSRTTPRHKKSRSNSRSKRKHKRSSTNNYKQKSPRAARHKKHGKHDTGISTASYFTTIIKEEAGESTDDDSSLMPQRSVSTRANLNAPNSTKSFFKSDLFENIDENDADPAMLERLQCLRDQELRREVCLFVLCNFHLYVSW